MMAVTQSAARTMYLPMREADLDEVVSAEGRTYRYPWTRGNFADALAAGYSAWVCREAGEGGVLLGYAVLMMVLDEAHLLNLSIVPERQGQGLGAGFLEHLFAVARSHAAARMYLEVRESNAAGTALYERHEFAVIGRRRGYYPAEGGRENAVVMARTL